VKGGDGYGDADIVSGEAFRRSILLGLWDRIGGGVWGVGGVKLTTMGLATRSLMSISSPMPGVITSWGDKMLMVDR